MKKLSEIISSFGMSENLRSALGWTMVHSVWQGLAIVFIFSLVLYFSRKSGVRYWAGIGALLFQVLASAMTFLWIYEPAGQAVTGGLPGQSDLLVSVSLTSVAEAKLSWIQQAEIFLYNHLDNFVTFWMAGACFLFIRLMAGFAYAQGLKVKQVNPVMDEVQGIMDDLLSRRPLKRTVRLLESVRAELPMTIGWLKPVILIPAGMVSGMSAEQLEAVLAHELAHIRRNDYLINIFQSFTEVLFFYHPAVWFISAKVRDERENCCDDFAVELCGDRLILAKALTQVAGYRYQPQFAMAFGAKRATFMDRIKRIVGIHDKKKSYVGNLTSVFIFALVMAAGLSFAKKQEEAVAEQNLSINEQIEQKKEAEKSVIEKITEALPFSLNHKDTVTLESLEREMQQLGKEMQKYGDKMKELGDQMGSRYGKEMEKKGAELEKLSKKMHDGPARDLEKFSMERQELALEIRKVEMKFRENRDSEEYKRLIKELRAKEASTDKLMEKSQKEMEEFQFRFAPIQKEMEKLHSPMDSLGRLMEKYHKPMDSLGKIMREKGQLLEKIAKEDEAKFKEELKEFSEMLFKNGWIKNKADYEIRLKGDKLLIDLEPQSKDVYDKVWGWMEKKWSKRYSQLGEKDLTIKVNGSNVNMNMKGGHNYYRSVGFVPPVAPVIHAVPDVKVGVNVSSVTSVSVTPVVAPVAETTVRIP